MLPSYLDRRGGFAADAVGAVGVAEMGLKPRAHGSRDFGRHRSSGLIVEIDHAARRLSAMSVQSETKRPTSTSVVEGPTLTRTTSRAAASSQPVAARTWLGLRLPAAQDLPAETAVPALSTGLRWEL